MLKLRSIGLSDYSVLEGEQRIGRIRFARARVPGVWLWNVNVHLTGGLPMGSSHDLDTAKAEADQLANLEQPFDLLLHRGRLGASATLVGQFVPANSPSNLCSRLLLLVVNIRLHSPRNDLTSNPAR